jgi:flagellar basal body P-ring protein FlgI
LLNEMQKLEVDNPNQLLASPTTDLVLVRGVLRPGIQKGDKFDVEVRVPSRSENRGLRGGWLMRTRLTEMAAVGGAVRPGDLMAWAEGPILVDPSASDGEDAVAKARGRILSGAISETSRPLGLVIRPSFRSVQVSSHAGVAINRRFHTFVQGVKTGVAKPMTDKYIELTVHPRYKDNVERFVRVVRSLPLKETTEEQLVRMSGLERSLLDPVSCAAAALKLEAIGKDAIPVLKKGLESPEVEVRFYSAEALAYLDDKAAAAPLGEIAAREPAFRAFALAALGAMDDFDAYEALRALLSSNSAETRYGAFRALWAMNEHDAFIRDAKINPDFHYHVLEVAGPPMIHFTRNTRPEIVVFGRDQRFAPPLSLEAGPRILVNSIDGERVSISRFGVNEADQKRITSLDVDEVVRAIADLGGTYPDIVQALQQAKVSKSLTGRLEIEAVPKAGRTYERRSADGEADPAAEEGEGDDLEFRRPAPSLFPLETAEAGDDEPAAETGEIEVADAKKGGSSRGWLGKMKFWE